MGTTRDATPANEIVARVWSEQGPRIYRSILAYSGDTEIAHDAVAEAFAQALGRGSEVRDTERWVWRAAFKIAAGELAVRSRTLPGDAGQSSVQIPEPVADLVGALRTLSPKQRTAIVLTIYADLSTRDAANVMGCSPATVRVHVSTARRRLRPLLEDHDA